MTFTSIDFTIGKNSGKNNQIIIIRADDGLVITVIFNMPISTAITSKMIEVVALAGLFIYLN